MDTNILLNELKTFKTFFDRSSACLTEEDSAFAPVEGVMTAAQTVFHVAQTVDWFFEGAFRTEGFKMEFDEVNAAIAGVTSLTAARRELDRAFADAEKIILAHAADAWDQPLPAGPVMGGAPRHAILGGLNDHTAHHRGALTVYSRLRGYEPAMPYL